MADNQIETPKSNTGKFIAIAVICFIFLIAIGVAVYFFFGDKLFGPSPPPQPSPTPSPQPSPIPSPPSGGGGGTGGTGSTGSGPTPPSPPQPVVTTTYLYIQQYTISPYPSYLSVRKIDNKMYLVPNYIATQENSLFDIDASGRLMFMDMSANAFRNIYVDRNTSEMNFVSDVSANNSVLLDRIYVRASSNPTVFQLTYENPTASTKSYLSTIPLTSTFYNVFGAVTPSQVQFSFLKRSELNPIKPLYFSLTKEASLSPKYLSSEGNVLSGTNFCYFNYDGKQIYNPNCQFYLDMSTFMLMKETTPNVYQYIKMNEYPSNPFLYIVNSYSLTNNVIRENVKFTAPDILSFDLNFIGNYVLIYLCEIKESNSDLLSDSLLRSRSSCRLGGFTQTPIPTPYVDLFTYGENGAALFLRNREVSDLSIPYLSLVDGEIANTIPNKYYIKDASRNIMLFKDDKFKYIDIANNTNGNEIVEYKDSLSNNTLRLTPTTSSTQFYITNTTSGNKCLIKKNNPTFGDYLGFKTTPGYNETCIIFQIEPK